MSTFLQIVCEIYTQTYTRDYNFEDHKVLNKKGYTA